MATGQLFATAAKARHAHGHLPVVLDLSRCPECGSSTTEVTAGQPALFRHGGYGATMTSVVRHCAAFCGWGVERSRTETNPRR